MAAGPAKSSAIAARMTDERMAATAICPPTRVTKAAIAPTTTAPIGPEPVW